MSDTNTPTADAPANDAPQLIAGKFADADALQQGIREIGGKLSKDFPDGDLIGNGLAFESVDEATASYQALERMLSRRQPAGEPEPDASLSESDSDTDKAADTDAPTGDMQIPEPEPLGEDAGLGDYVKAAGLNMQDLVAQVKEHGRLTDEQYAALSKTPPPRRAFEEAIVAGDVAAESRQAATNSKVASVFGGQEQAQAVLKWAAANYTADQVAALNAQLTDPKQAEIAAKAIRYDHQQAVGSTNDRGSVRGQAASTGGQVIPVAEREKFRQLLTRSPSPAVVERYKQHRAAGGPPLAAM